LSPNDDIDVSSTKFLTLYSIFTHLSAERSGLPSLLFEDAVEDLAKLGDT
jgi:hypothetical protein